MANRYSGSLKIHVVYDDHGHYRTSVSSGGKLLWRGNVNPAPSGFGPGIAYDSPKAYDEIASSAIAFADDEKRGIADEAEFDEDLTGYLIRRTPRGKTGKTATASHATRKKLGRPPTAKRDYQYRAVVVGKGLLLGGTKRHVSSWFRTKQEADDFAWAISTGNEAVGRKIAFVTIERRHDGVIETVKWAHAGEVEV